MLTAVDIFFEVVMTASDSVVVMFGMSVFIVACEAIVKRWKTATGGK